MTEIEELKSKIKKLERDNEDMHAFTFFKRCKYCGHLSPSDFCCHTCGYVGDDGDYTEADKVIMRAGKNPKHYRKDN